jgi:hypothetical protein
MPFEMNRKHFFLCFIAVSIALLFVFHLIRVRLTLRHPALFARLGEPRFNDSNLEAKYWDFQAFVFWGYFSVKDRALVALCVTATIAAVVNIILFALSLVE